MGEPQTVEAGPVQVGTVEAWAWELIHTAEAERKLNPDEPPEGFEETPVARRPAAPSRPWPLRARARAEKSPRPGALLRPESRARLMHLFLHHELQAAEIFAWALLAFPDAPAAFRRGLLGICRDELRHARMYRGQVERLGARWGDFEVRDWFWERFAACRTPLEFVALMGLGFEGGNLDHGALWAERLRAAGDEEAARCVDAVGEDEVEHVAFARRWFERFAGGFDFDRWRAALPPPLTPSVLRGRPIASAARARAGLDEDFIARLEAWEPPGSGC